MAILVTGAAGFIGSFVSDALLKKGVEVIGVDNLNDYYSPELKLHRLSALKKHTAFRFEELELAEAGALEAITKGAQVSHVIHLAAQAGVRYSLENPAAYVSANLVGHANVLEYCRYRDEMEHLIFASSSSVYGGNKKVPFSESDPVDQPVSLYAATKKSDELLSHAYSKLYGMPQTGLRFFTVYGPQGRPDMAYWSFTKAILEGSPIRVFNHGDMRRDFTYIDDVVEGILRIVEKGPQPTVEDVPYGIYNIGNNKPEPLMRMIEVLEDIIGKPAEKVFEPMQPGDVKETFADISAIKAAYGFQPVTQIDEGLEKFVTWYRDYHKV